MDNRVDKNNFDKLQELYRFFPEDARKEISELADKYIETHNIDITEKKHVICNIIRYRSSKVKFFKFIPCIDYTKFYAENSNGDRLYFIKNIGLTRKQNVFLTYSVKNDEHKPTDGFLRNLKDYEYKNSTGRECFKVIKWGTDKEMSNEIKGWKYCINNTIPNPSVDMSYNFFGIQCVTMKILSTIKFDNENNYIDVGIQILSILKIFHTYGCHSDIKPSNIMCERIELHEKKKYMHKYYLIDMGGMTCDRYEHGYKRRSWTWDYVTQEIKKGEINIITPKIDLLELGITLSIIYHKCIGNDLEKKDYKSIKVTNPLYSYVEYANKLNDVCENDYEVLKNMLLKNKR